MHSIRGQALPSTYLEHPHDLSTPKPKQKNKDEEKEKEKAKERAKEKAKEKEKEKKKAFSKDQERMVSTSLLTSTAFLGNMATPSSATTIASTSKSSSSTSASASVPPSPSSAAYSSSLGRNRSSSSTSSLTVPFAGVIEGNRSRSSSNTSTLPSSLFRHKQSTGVDDKDKDHQQPQHQPHAGFPQYHQQSHFYLQKRQPSNPSSLPPPLLPKHSSSSTSSSSSSIFRRKKHDPTPTSTATSTHIHSNHHSILMVPQHDIHITWPHPVPSGNIYIAGTWSVPGHGPWEKLAMTPVEGTDSLFEIHLNVNEIEDITDYLDDEGHIHHELTAEGHHLEEAAAKLSKRQRLRRFFGRAKGKNSKDGASTPLPGQAHTHLPHDAFLPLTKEYRYQYKFVVDDQWMCDVDRHQVQDNEGHWNHELVVELIEHIQGSSSSSDSVRSRSSSLQSVQSINNAHLSDAHPYQPPQAALPADSSAISTEKPTLQEDEVKQASRRAQASSSSSKSRDTYEAVLMSAYIVHLDENTATPPVTAPTETVAITVAEASPKATQDATVSVASEGNQHAENIIVSSSVAEPIESSEPTIINKSEIAESEFDLAISVALPESDVEPESIDEAPEIEPVRAHVPEPVPVPESQQTSVFVLQEAANPEERSRADQPSSSLSSLLSDDEEESQVRPRSIAIITETTPESVLSYQVPSPPLTPSSAPCYMASTSTFVTPSTIISEEHNNNKSNDKQEADDHFEPEGKTSFESTTSTAVDEHHLASILLTPRSEHPSPIATIVLQDKEVAAVEPRALEFDVVGEKASSSVAVESTSQDESVLTTTTTTTDKKDGKPRELPEKYPNLVWSICKTTVVVSAAVVVLGLGLGGRQKK
ncbi:hypothetical protein BGZ92_004517 [Podila epicladia]|nr:hypothetical protein BGZ92_004517 [Podila epicladia]